MQHAVPAWAHPAILLALSLAPLAAEGAGRPAIPPGSERSAVVHLRVVDGVARIVSTHETAAVGRPQRVPRADTVVEALAPDGSLVASVEADFQPAVCACLPDPATGVVQRHEHGALEAFVRIVDRGQATRLRLRGGPKEDGAQAPSVAHGAAAAQEVAWPR